MLAENLLEMNAETPTERRGELETGREAETKT
jgi:hypothetical protein